MGFLWIAFSTKYFPLHFMTLHNTFILCNAQCTFPEIHVNVWISQVHYITYLTPHSRHLKGEEMCHLWSNRIWNTCKTEGQQTLGNVWHIVCVWGEHYWSGKWRCRDRIAPKYVDFTRQGSGVTTFILFNWILCKNVQSMQSFEREKFAQICWLHTTQTIKA